MGRYSLEILIEINPNRSGGRFRVKDSGRQEFFSTQQEGEVRLKRLLADYPNQKPGIVENVRKQMKLLEKEG